MILEANPNLVFTITVTITHLFRGDLAISLVSPSGTSSRLSEIHADEGDDYNEWKFMSVRHWSESSARIWTVKDHYDSRSTAFLLAHLVWSTDSEEPHV